MMKSLDPDEMLWMPREPPETFVPPPSAYSNPRTRRPLRADAEQWLNQCVSVFYATTPIIDTDARGRQTVRPKPLLPPIDGWLPTPEAAAHFYEWHNRCYPLTPIRFPKSITSEVLLYAPDPRRPGVDKCQWICWYHLEYLQDSRVISSTFSYVLVMKNEAEKQRRMQMGLQPCPVGQPKLQMIFVSPSIAASFTSALAAITPTAAVGSGGSRVTAMKAAASIDNDAEIRLRDSLGTGGRVMSAAV